MRHPFAELTHHERPRRLRRLARRWRRRRLLARYLGRPLRRRRPRPAPRPRPALDRLRLLPPPLLLTPMIMRAIAMGFALSLGATVVLPLPEVPGLDLPDQKNWQSDHDHYDVDADPASPRGPPLPEVECFSDRLDVPADLPASQRPHLAARSLALGAERIWTNVIDASEALGRSCPPARCCECASVYGDEQTGALRVRGEDCLDRYSCGVCGGAYVEREVQRAKDLFLAIRDARVGNNPRARVLAMNGELTIPAPWSARLSALPPDRLHKARQAFARASRAFLRDVWGAGVGAVVVQHTWHSGDPVEQGYHLHAHFVASPLAVDSTDRVRALAYYFEDGTESFDWLRSFWTRRVRAALRPYLGRLEAPPKGCVLHYQYIKRNEVDRLHHRLRYQFRSLAADLERWLAKQGGALAWLESGGSRDKLAAAFVRLDELRRTRRWTWAGSLSAGAEVTKTGPRVCAKRTRRVLGIPDAIAPEVEAEERDEERPPMKLLLAGRIVALEDGALVVAERVDLPALDDYRPAIAERRITLPAGRWAWFAEDTFGSPIILNTPGTSLGSKTQEKGSWRARAGPRAGSAPAVAVEF